LESFAIENYDDVKDSLWEVRTVAKIAVSLLNKIERKAAFDEYEKLLRAGKVKFHSYGNGKENQYTKPLTKWVDLEALRFYCSLEAKIVNIPFSADYCLEEMMTEE
jgi:hypothetical protein